MKNIFRHPTFWLSLLLLVAYICAEIIIRGDALNRISYSIGGFLFWGGIVLLVYCWILLPILRFSTFPKWIEPETISSRRAQINYLQKMGKYYVSIFRKKQPEEIADLIPELKKTLKSPPADFAEYHDKLQQLVSGIHSQLSENVCNRVVNDYMKKTAVLVCISQQGWLDSVAMLVMQVRMIIDLSRSLGYRPTWFFILYCLCWVFVNSIAFALFDGTEIVDDAMQELLPFIVSETAGKSIPILGKLFGVALQGASAMAVVYVTGKIVQRKLAGSQQRLSGKERIKLRIEGYKAAVGMLKPF